MSVLSYLIITLAQNQPPGAGPAPARATPAPASPAAVTSVWDLAIRGGPTMILIALCSIVALTIVVERLISLRRSRAIPPGFMAGLDAALPDRDRALVHCRASPSSIANILGAAIKRLGDGPAAVEKTIEEAGQREVVRFRQRMRVLSALPQVATMLGLLGTILGMIKTFQAIAISGEALGKTELLARGIYEAWTATAAGLLVAIPVLVAYHSVQGKIDALIAELDRVANDWLERLRNPAPAVAPAAATPRAAVTPAAPSLPAPTPDLSQTPGLAAT